MKIYLGADHNGFYMRGKLLDYLKQAGYDVEDDGDIKLDPGDDFPVFASKVVKRLLASSDSDPRGILVCGSGQGMCMAANRYKGIRAAIAWDREAAKASRNDEDSNVLCLPARVLEQDKTNVIVEAWLNTPFAAATRYIRRNKKLDQLG